MKECLFTLLPMMEKLTRSQQQIGGFKWVSELGTSVM